MKRIILTAIIVISSCPGCHAETNNKTVKNHLTTANQVNNTVQPKISLNCQGFELDHSAYLLCDYWQKSNRLNQNIKMENFTKYHEINSIRDLSPSDYAFYATTQLMLNGTKYNAYIYPNSRITLENPNKKVKSEMTGEIGYETTEYICQNHNCKSMFLWGYSDEGLAGENPKVEEQSRLEYEKLLKSLTVNSYNDDFKKSHPKGIIKAKIYMNNTNTSKNQFVYRDISSISPLKDSITSYLSGTTIEEATQGYKANNLGITDFNVNIKSHTAYINFRSENLEVESPQDVIDFDLNIIKTAKQFKNIKDVNLCINGISNYQTTLFANEPIKKCKF